jgi:RND family efflux transporter MFP subunit
MKNTILPLLALVSVSLGLISVVRSQPVRESTLPPAPPPARGFRSTVAAVGLVETSTENISIGTPLSDVVTEVAAVVGRSVNAGDPLFRLDDRQRQADLELRQSELRVAEAQEKVEAARLEDARQQLSFVEHLRETGAVSKEEVAHRVSAVDTEKALVEEAKARISAAKAQIRVIHAQLERSVVRAPVDGQVLQVKIHPGEFAPAGVTSTPLVLLGRLRPLHIRVDVDEHEAWRVRAEAKASAAVRGNADRKVSLTFVRFEPFVLPKKSLTGDSTERVDTRVLQVLYRVEEEDPGLFVGQQMDVFIDAEGSRT